MPDQMPGISKMLAFLLIAIAHFCWVLVPRLLPGNPLFSRLPPADARQEPRGSGLQGRAPQPVENSDQMPGISKMLAFLLIAIAHSC